MTSIDTLLAALDGIVTKHTRIIHTDSGKKREATEAVWELRDALAAYRLSLESDNAVYDSVRDSVWNNDE